MKSAVGIGVNEDSYSSGVEAAQAAFDAIGEKPALTIVFASVEYAQEDVIRGVRSVAPDTLLVGSSSSGEITGEGPVKRHSVVVMMIAGDEIVVHAAVGKHIQENAHQAGSDVAQQVLDAYGGEKPKFFMMFPDVLAGNGADIVRGVKTVLGDTFPIVGGASGDDFQFKQTFQYLNDEVYSGSVVGVGFSGNIVFGVGVKHGWTPISLPRKVTKAEGSVVHEIDGLPAISIYKEYFGEEEAKQLESETLAKLAITYPLGIRHEESNEYLIRDPLTVDEHGSITCAAEIPEGSEVQLMIGSREEAIDMAEHAAKNALEQLDGATPQAVVIFNCIARQKLFGINSGDEIERIMSVLGPMVPMAGFYTYGEQAPLDGEVRDIKKCNSQFHNETVVIVVLGEGNSV